MSHPMKARLVIKEIVAHEHDVEILKFRAVCKEDQYPETGKDENNTFAKFSPTFDSELHLMNPDLLGKYRVGDMFDVDFVPIASKYERSEPVE